MTAAATTRAEELVEAARALGPRIQAVRDQIDAERRLPQPLVDAMVDAALFRLWVPKSMGGEEVDTGTAVRVVEAVARADGSAGWSLMIGAGTGIFSGYLPERGAREIYGSDPRTITGGFFVPRGRAVPVEGGYRVSGRWSFGSGSTHCNWLLGGCLVMDGDNPRLLADGSPDWKLMYFPAGDFQIIDTWTVGGLRGTASHDYAVEDVFVPGERAVTFAGRPVQPGTLYAFPLFPMLACCVAGVALGIARGAIDALTDLAGKKTPVGGEKPLRDRALVQAQIAQAEGLLRSARSFVFETLATVWNSVAAGQPASLDQRALLRLAATHAADSAARAVDLMNDVGGTSALYASNPLERAFRDVHAVRKHVLVQTVSYEPIGRAFLGIEPGPIF